MMFKQQRELMKTARKLSCSWYLIMVLATAGFFLNTGILCSAQDLTSSTISNSLSNFDEAFEELQKERKALKEEVDDLKRDRQIVRDTFDKKVEEIENQKIMLTEALENAQSRAQQIESEKINLMEDIQDLKLKLGRHDDVVNVKDAALSEAKQEIDRLNEHIGKIEQAFERSAKRIQKLQEEKEDLQRELQIMKDEREKILFGYEDNLKKLKEEKEKFEFDGKSAQEKLKKLEEKTSRVDSRQDDSRQKHKKEMLKVVADQGLLKKEINDSVKERATLIRQHAKEMAGAVERVEENAKEAQEVKKKNKKLEYYIKRAQEKMDDYRRQIESFKKQDPLTGKREI